MWVSIAPIIPPFLMGFLQIKNPFKDMQMTLGESIRDALVLVNGRLS